MSRSGFAARRTAPNRRITGQDWAAQIDAARWLAGQAMREGDADAGAGRADFAGRLVLFRHQVADLTPDSFPMGSRLAQLLAAAWINIARAFAHAEMDPVSRTACAPWLEIASLRIDRMWSDHRAAVAQSTWGRQFKGED